MFCLSPPLYPISCRFAQLYFIERSKAVWKRVCRLPPSISSQLLLCRFELRYLFQS